MKFRTEYNPLRGEERGERGESEEKRGGEKRGERRESYGTRILNPEKGVVLLGSCFADNMRRRMRGALWDAENPFGVLFNPLSIARNVELALDMDEKGNLTQEAERIVEDSIFEAGGCFHTWLFDSKKSGMSRAIVKEGVMESLREFNRRMRRGDSLIITFGTAWCYFLNGEGEEKGIKGNCGEVVANCHKQPQQLFERRRISISEISERWIGVIRQLKELSPNLKIIFTVSPVRHLKDGFVENARSKATLLLAVEEICSKERCCSYFPAFEILNDDLRDYRFYAEDLVHPSEMAVDYIWDMFKQTYLDEVGNKLLREGEQLARRAAHRSILPDTETERKFREQTRIMLEDFAMAHPGMLRL